MFPNDFDGVLAGAPAWWTTHLQTWTLKVGLTNLAGTPGHIPTPLFSVINNEVFRQCDGVDGLLDGVITDPKACDFHPEPFTLHVIQPNKLSQFGTIANSV